jgi:serine/threonine protein kinase/tetratricopeptide (TPR) repeat protein
MADTQLELRAIFCEALDRQSPREQAEYLDQACQGRPALRARVEALLGANAEAGDFLLEPTLPAVAPVAVAGGSERPGTRLGPYELLEPIGEGGMGAVWLAEQTEPVCRKVALKIIKPGMDSKQVLARFEQERQALALMDHPNVARILDAGATDAGRPYFVMELVKGVPITTFCDQNLLTPRQRLELFVPVCQAIQHAHTKGVIHRDVKPSNVLVVRYDGVSVPKVIDFGIAKAVGQRLTEQTLVTGFGQLLGTLEYMSPEQAAFNALDIDTRSDVYALGVLLYELLTGTTPLGSRRLRETPLAEVLRLIREEEPPKPSTRLSDSETLPGIAAARKTEPALLARLLRGELDWIVMKALEKDRGRRYESANSLAADVERYLRDEPVEACPPSAAYRLRKFVRRHRGPVLAAATIILLLVAGVAVSTWQAVRATVAEGAERRAREQAERDRDAKGTALRNEAQERKYAQAIADFVRDDFLALTSVEGQDRFGGSTEVPLNKDTTLRQLLDRAAAKLNQRHDLDPRTEAELRWIIGVNYRHLGEVRLAIPFLERCAALRNELFGPDHEATLVAQNSLAVAYGAAGRRDLALPLLEETLRLTKASLGDDHPETILRMFNLAKGYRDVGNLDLALPLSKETLGLAKARLGDDHPRTLLIMFNLAEGYRDDGKLNLALPLMEETLKRAKARLGDDHPDTLTYTNNLATGYEDAGKPDLALPLLEETLKRRKARLGDNHLNTLSSMNNLALRYAADGKPGLALPLMEATLRGAKARLGDDHPNTLSSMGHLASLYEATGESGLALPLYERAAAGMEKLRFQHPASARVVSQLISGYDRLQQFDRSEPWRRKWLAVVKERSGAASAPYAGELSHLGRNLLAQRKWADAEVVLREALDVGEQRQPDAWTTFDARSMLGGALSGQQKYAEAEPLLVRGYEGLKQRKDQLPEPAMLTKALEQLVQLYEATGRTDRAAAYRQELEAVTKTKP